MKINRRQMVQLSAAGMVAPHLLLGTRSVWGQAGAGKKTYALHIGVDTVDHNKYGGAIAQLYGCKNDARTMKDILGRVMQNQPQSRSIMLTDVNATNRNILGHILWAAHDLAPGDLFVITYSGHGGQLPDQNGDEADDARDETWCLYDGQLRDDILYTLWGQFQAGVRILVISDSCHSGTVAKEKAFASSLLRGLSSTDTEVERRARGAFTRSRDPNARNLDSLVNQLRAIAQRGRDTGVRSKTSFNLRSLTPSEVTQAITAYVNGAAFDDRDIPAGRGDKRGRSSVGASGLLLSGCLDSEFSMEYGGAGLFTSKLKETWANGGFAGEGYRDFLDEINTKMLAQQTANFFPFGQANDDFYYRQQPFQV